jgi:glycosyltransferase involved in cell wall biosynthesis
MKPKLSILIATIPGREEQSKALSEKLANQIGNLPVEYLILSDNRKRSIGAKRQALWDIAEGEYAAMVDDDDDISDNYIEELLKATETGAEVITFEQRAIYNGLESKVVFKLGQGDHAFIPNGITLRDAWHVCAWRLDRVKDCQFLYCNYGEDKAWSLQARQQARTSFHIPMVLHTYRHDAETTAAPEPNGV